MKYTQLRFHFGRKCLAIRHRLLTEFFPPIESARQESNRAHGSLERAHARPRGNDERTTEPRPTFIPRERRVSRYRNEIATGREDPGTRAVSHRRGVCDPRPTVRGAWARSKHHLDHSESQPQGLRSIRRDHQPHVVVARASSARPSENS